MDFGNSLKKFFSIIGVCTIVAGAVFLLLKHFDDKAHDEKWKDYYDCGVA